MVISPPRVEFNAFTHTWSLGVEEQFYLLFPLVFFIYHKSNAVHDWRTPLYKLLLPGLIIISLLYCAYVTTSSPQHAYYLLPSRFWELGCGAGLYILHKKELLLPKSRQISTLFLTLGLMLVSIGLCFSVPSQFPFPWALLPVIGCVLIISGVVSERPSAPLGLKLLDNSFMTGIGRMSYSLYLWHWPVLVMFRWTVGLEATVPIICAAILTVILSFLSLRWIETPFRDGRFFRGKSSNLIVAKGLMLAVFCCVATFSLFKLQPKVSLSTTKDYAAWYPQAWDVNVNQNANKAGDFAGRRLYVLGDSHAGSYGTMLRKLVEQDGVEVRLYSMAGCSVANLLSPASPDCAEFIRRSVAEITEISRPGDIVFLASLRMRRLSDQWTAYDVEEIIAKQQTVLAAENRAVALLEASQLISSLEKNSLKVILDAPKPIFKSPPFRCSDSFNRMNPVCKGGLSISRDFLEKHRSPVMHSLDTLKREHDNLIVWDIFSTLCEDKICSAYKEERPLFFDGDHMSGYANILLYPVFKTLLISAWEK